MIYDVDGRTKCRSCLDKAYETSISFVQDFNSFDEFWCQRASLEGEPPNGLFLIAVIASTEPLRWENRRHLGRDEAALVLD